MCEYINHKIIENNIINAVFIPQIICNKTSEFLHVTNSKNIYDYNKADHANDKSKSMFSTYFTSIINNIFYNQYFTRFANWFRSK